MGRDYQVLRQWKLWRLLAGRGRALSTKEIVDELGDVGPRTVRRDLAVLREIGVPIAELNDDQGVRYTTTDDGPPLRLDPDMLLALRLALGLLRPFESTELGRSLGQLVRTLEARVPARVATHFGSLTDELVVRLPSAPSYDGRDEVLAAIRSAIASRRALRIVYDPLEGERSEREIEPRSLVYGPRGLYLIAGDRSRGGETRTFRTERVAQAELGESLPREEPFDAEAYLSDSLGIHSPEHDLREVEIRIHCPKAFRLLTENPWHPSQVVVRDGDTWRVTWRLRSFRELIPRLLALGPDGEVLRPHGLRRAVAELVRSARERYEDLI